MSGIFVFRLVYDWFPTAFRLVLNWFSIQSKLQQMDPLHSLSFLGPPGTYSNQAALSFTTNLTPLSTIKSLFTSKTEYALVPFENSTHGSVSMALSSFPLTSKTILDSVSLEINHALLSLPGAIIKKIYSHEQALGQCKSYLEKEFKGVELVSVQSTAQGALLASTDNGLIPHLS